MNLNDIRRLVADELEAFKPEYWHVSIDTLQRPTSGLLHVGHFTEITPDTFGTVMFNLYLTAWVNEIEDADGVDKLYTLISPGADSLLTGWTRSTATQAGKPIVETVGTTAEGPTRFLAAVIRIPMQHTFC